MSCLNHVVDGLDQVGEVSERLGLLEIEVSGDRLVLTFEPAREAEGAAITFVDPTVRHGNGSFEAVTVVDEKYRSVLGLRGRHAIIPFCVSWNQGESGFEERFREAVLIQRLPHFITLKTLHGRDAGLAALADRKSVV